MNRIRHVMACTAASTLLTLGALGLATPAQADTGAPTASVTVTDVRADDTSGTGCSDDCNGHGDGLLGGLLGGLLHLVGGLLGGGL